MDTNQIATDMANTLNTSFNISIGWAMVIFLIGLIWGFIWARRRGDKRYLRRWRAEEPGDYE